MQDPLVGLTVVVVLAVGCMVLAARLRIPAIVPLLIAGVLAGPSVADLVDPNELLGDLLSPFVSLAVGVILFEGALGLRREELEDDTPPVVVRLLTLGALITWAVGFGGVVVLLDLPGGIALLVGAILIVSEPIAQHPAHRRLRVHELEQREHQGGDRRRRRGGAVADAAAGHDELAAGLGGNARRGGRRHRRGRPRPRRRRPGGAIVAGLVMANQRTVPLSTILEFKETLGLLLIGLLFILLSALVVPSQVVDLGLAGIGFVALLVLVARPLGVLLSARGSSLSWRERGLVAWMAPRGIIAASTASTFSLKLVADHVDGAEKIVPVVFLVIACTVVLYAFTAPPLARALGVSVE